MKQGESQPDTKTHQGWDKVGDGRARPKPKVQTGNPTQIATDIRGQMRATSVSGNQADDATSSRANTEDESTHPRSTDASEDTPEVEDDGVNRPSSAGGHRRDQASATRRGSHPKALGG